MAQIPNYVNPGDLIVASFFNSVLAALSDHETRITRLESSLSTAGTPVINQVVPSGGVHPGDQLQLIGNNFGVPALNTVTLAGAVVSSFTADSNNTVLKFTVPAIPGIPSSGQTATLNLSNPNGFASATVFLLPAQAALPQGNLFVAMSKTVPVATVTAGQNLLFQFEVKGNASQNETYNVTPAVDVGWAATLVDSASNPIIPSQINLTLDANGNFDNFFFITVAVPAGLANGVTGKLTVFIASKLNPAFNNQPLQALPITVGSPPPGATNAVIVSVSDVVNATLSGSTVTVTAGQQAAVDLTAVVQSAGNYDTAVPVLSVAAGWTVAYSHATAAGDYSFTAPPLSQPVRVLVTATPAAAQTTLPVAVSAVGNAAIKGQIQLTLQHS